MTTLFIGFFLYILWNDPWFLRRFKALIIAILFVLMGLSIDLYLPIRAAGNPYLNWGNPSNFDRFLRHVQREQYEKLEFSEEINLKTKLQFLSNFGEEFQEQFASILFLFSIVGIIILMQKQVKGGSLTAFIFILNTLFLILLIQFPYTRENTLRFKVYYIPAYTVASVWIGIGIHQLCRIFTDRKFKFIQYLLLLFPLSTILNNYYFNDRSHYFLARDYVTNILSDVKPQGIVFPSADYQTFPMEYLQLAERIREDVMIGDMYGSLHENVAREYFEKVAKKPGVFKKDEILVNLIKGSTRPIYFSSKDNVPPLDGYQLKPAGLIFQAVPKNVSLENEENWNLYRTRGITDSRIFKESMGRSIEASYSYFRGQNFLDKGQVDKALIEFEIVLKRDPSVAENCNNIGSSLAEHGFPDYAIQFFKKAITYYDAYALPRVNLAKIYRTKNMTEQALKYYNEAIKKDPDNEQFREEYEEYLRTLGMIVEDEFTDMDAVTLNNWGSKLAEEGRTEEAEKIFLRALKHDSSYALPLKNLGTLYLQQKKFKKARQCFSEY